MKNEDKNSDILPLSLSKLIVTLFFIYFVLGGNTVSAQPEENNCIHFRNTKELQNYFRYKEDGPIIISGHRGGRETNFPENSIEGLRNVLTQMPAIFEIDPRLTKDGVVVLMHDATLDRTTTGKGKLSDYTWAELQSIRLKDAEGNTTPYKIPTLEKVITWSKGKTIINLDKKDVPMETIAALIKKHKAEKHVMVTVHTGAQARFYYDRIPGIMMSAFARTAKEFEDLTIAGVPWENMIAYVGPTIDENNANIVAQLHERGVRCMVSYAPTHDKLSTPEEREKAYRDEIKKRPDIIESDIPTEIWTILQSK
ncbi:MAG: glycerophosphodiester phosphodiesterase family protein [Prolixibacteraceae bacterium]|jgi:glycerophosphoryl diester phosphodiesterase|nr:glycerophosphodiester phosphodiesterase family protein [Prolixibacteraceae bacterium]